MAKSAYFRLEHSAVNRARHGSGYLAAHANYAANTNKCAKVIHINGAEDRSNIRKLIYQHEASLTRKNARVADKILISLPVELTEEHRHEAVRRFLRSITFDGKTRAFAFYHNDHPHNPHAHIIFLDRDLSTGQPVAMMGANRQNRTKAGHEPNATEWLRKTWETDCNAVFSEFGYDLFIDRRRNLERGMEEPGKHRGWDAENDNTQPIAQAEPPVAEQDVEPEPEPDNLPPEPEDACEGEPDMDYIAVGDVAPEDLSPAERIKVAREANYEARAIREAIERKEMAVRRYEAAKLVAQRAVEAFSSEGIRTMAAEQAYQNALNSYNATHQPNGKAKGFKLSLFGRTVWQTETSKAAEQAERRLFNAEYNYSFAKKDLEQADNYSKTEASRAQALFDEAQAYVARLEQTYGTDEEAQQAVAAYENTVKAHLKDMTAEEIMVMVDEGEITTAEAVEVLQIMGRDAEAQMLLDAEMRRDKSQGDDGIDI